MILFNCLALGKVDVVNVSVDWVDRQASLCCLTLRKKILLTCRFLVIEGFKANVHVRSREPYLATIVSSFFFLQVDNRK